MDLRRLASFAAALATALAAAHAGRAAPSERRLPVREYVDRMKAGWVGQMVGVGWGGPTEFNYKGTIMPSARVPRWEPGMVNQFGQDDIYVEMTFVRTLEQYGLGASIRQAGVDFANSGYRLWHANAAGRDNLRRGIAPPDSGHPQFNMHADDIDYQIEADFSGLIAPGLPNVAIALGEKFGRLMNYGDGLYGGQFVGGMYAAAFFETDMERIIRAGLACIPPQSQYAECVRDVLAWHQAHPDDWESAWRLLDEKYQKNPAYRRFSCDKGDFNIDAKLNGAYVVMGLLYGKRDPDESIKIAMRCGQDSDCNPSSTGGVLFTTIGFARLPDRFTSALNPAGKFSHTPYDFPTLVAVCEKLACQAVEKAGGRVEKDPSGEEVFVIPVQAPQPGRLEQCWQPGPIANSRFTPAEMAGIGASPAPGGETEGGGVNLQDAVEKATPGWSIARCGPDMDPGLRARFRGRDNVLCTHPESREVGCVLSKSVAIPAGRRTFLHLVVSHDPQGDWTLLVRADGKELFSRDVGPATVTDGWLTADVDLSAYAGKTVNLELVNQANGWAWEAGYWAEIRFQNP